MENMENKKETGLKTYFAVIPQMGEYVAKTIEPSELTEFEFGFEVHAKETGIQSTQYTGRTEQYPRGSFDITVYHKGQPGEFKINGWSFSGILNGSYETKNVGIKYWLDMSICDPEGLTNKVRLYENLGNDYYIHAARQYLKTVMDHCIYNSLEEYKLLNKASFTWLLSPSVTDVNNVRDDIAKLQLLSDVIQRLDMCDEIPNQVKSSAQERYSSLIKRIKESSGFEKLFEIMINAIPQQE